MNSLYAAVGYTGGCYLFMLVEAVFCKELQLLRILQSKTKTVKEIIEVRWRGRVRKERTRHGVYLGDRAEKKEKHESRDRGQER